MFDNWQVNGPVSFKAWLPVSIDLINGRSCLFISHVGKRFKGISEGRLTHFKLPAGNFYGYLNCNKGAH